MGKPKKLHKIRLETDAGNLEFDNIIEYDWGFYYLFIRTVERTLSIGRDIITKAYRWYDNNWIEINIKKIKSKKK